MKNLSLFTLKASHQNCDFRLKYLINMYNLSVYYSSVFCYTLLWYIDSAITIKQEIKSQRKERNKKLRDKNMVRK